MIECNKCGTEKEDEEFYWAVKDVRRTKVCKKCRNAQMKEYAQTDRGKATAKKADAKYNKTDKGKERRAEYDQTEKRKAVKKKASIKYIKTNKGRTAQARTKAKRRTKKLAEINTLIPEQWEQIKGDQDHKCNGCHAPFTEEKPATEDHIIPLGEGPGRTEENIQALCGSCNSIKGLRSMEYLLEKLAGAIE